MKPTQPPLFYVKVWDQFPDSPGAKLHPHFTQHHAYPVLSIDLKPTGDVQLMIPDDRQYFAFASSAHCTFVRNQSYIEKDKKPTERRPNP